MAALKTQFPLFAPPHLRPQPQRSPTEVQFARWNNANAQKFIRRERTQQELEDQLRIEKRFDSAHAIIHNYNPAPPYPTGFKSTGTPSTPSSPSIPGKKSKYSKPPPDQKPHPAFKPLTEKPRKYPPKPSENQNLGAPNFRIDEKGVSYELPEAPFLYQYSYTETPNMKPVKLREPLVSPFGPGTMPKPWLGRKPFPPSKKKLPEFDSFQLPPPHKKGVKPVQAPGPFLPGSGPKYVRSREEVLGTPLTKEEIEDLINGCKKTNRQLNIGRDGLTHNMLDNIHAHWKRRRVCKIKCRGVCTVDMENVCKQLEEKSGGKIIYNRGGIIYLFRGRNYNYRTRPQFPLMLWKPASPVYPRLVKRVPEGLLTLEEASLMRKRGRALIPICKLGKNGVYFTLVEDIREAFEACDIVRINCEGMNPSDFKKIGAKLKDLVPCVLVSFEREHILIWRGHNWKSSFETPKESLKGSQEAKVDDAAIIMEPNSNEVESSSSQEHTVSPEEHTVSPEEHTVSPEEHTVSPEEHTVSLEEHTVSSEEHTVSSEIESDSEADETEMVEPEKVDMRKVCTEGILLLRNEAIGNGLAFVLENDDILDADAIFKRAVTFAKTAPAGPLFPLRRKKPLAAETNKEQKSDEEMEEIINVSGTRNERKSNRGQILKKDNKGDYLNVAVPKGNLRVDELAKLLA